MSAFEGARPLVGNMQSLTFGPGSVDWQHRVDPTELRNQRKERAREVLKELGISVVLVSGSEYCRYLTGLQGPEFAPDLWYVLFPVESEPVVFAHAGYVRNTPPEAPWIHEWRIARSWLRGIPGLEACKIEATAFAQDVRTELQRLQLLDEPLAVVGFDRYAYAALDDVIGQTIPGEPALQRAMAVKTDEELACLRMAASITDRMWAAMASGLKIGMTDTELASIGRAAASSGGAESTTAGFRIGPLAQDRGIKGTNQFIMPGDVLIGNVCGTSYLGYKACSYRTFCAGRSPSSQEQGWMDRLQDRIMSVVGELRPGSSTDLAARHFPSAAESGYNDEVELLTIEIGHGIGLHQYEQPVVNRQWSIAYPQEIVEGMVVAVEGRDGVPGESTVRIESMAIVTKEGPKLIDRYSLDIISAG